ncbi:MAG: type II toxin-antitoxin system RelE/ParE family toxin [Chloroflexi bacterium]|nr:type II toxin-antitoxin system RelE/ParE family toxin [Chloroflexota bacterium]
MGAFEIRLMACAEKDLRRLAKGDLQPFVDRIARLEDDALPPRRIKLKGTQRLFRVRVGDYRIVYEVDATARIVMIHYIRHRRDAYRH